MKMIAPEEDTATSSETVIIWLETSNRDNGDLLTDVELDEIAGRVRSNLEKNPLIRC